MIRIRQHIPGFIEGATPKRAEAATIHELLAEPWLKSWEDGDLIAKRDPATGETAVSLRPFYRWSVARDGHPMLMAELDEGRHWWVVGYLETDGEPIDLPEWQMHPDGKADVERWNRGEG
jgi:hypothetical protein